MDVAAHVARRHGDAPAVADPLDLAGAVRRPHGQSGTVGHDPEGRRHRAAVTAERRQKDVLFRAELLQRRHGPRVVAMDQPVIGDVFGEMIRDAYAVRTGIGPRPLAGGRVPRPVIEIIERDDGLINGAPADHYLAEPAEWQPHDHRALRLVRGAVLDIGAGAGRTAIELQRRGMAVTGLDTSPGAIEVARRRGLRDTVLNTVDSYARSAARYDTFLLLGNNLGLIEGP